MTHATDMACNRLQKPVTTQRREGRVRATIRDVAREAGVSIATVSRAMRDPGSVRPETRERVHQVASRLHYVPSHLGRQLAERRHAANGIVFPDLSGPYFAEVVLGYAAVAGELGRSVLILSTAGREDADAAVAAMAERCDGLVVLGQTVSDETVASTGSRGTPVVLVARPPMADVDSVRAHNLEGARALAHHVLDTGARQVAFVGDPASEFGGVLLGRLRPLRGARTTTGAAARRLRAAHRRRAAQAALVGPGDARAPG